MNLPQLLKILRPATQPQASQSHTNQLQLETLEPRQMLSTVQIFAAGSEGGEQMALEIDGAEVSTWNVQAGAEVGNFQTYVFDTPENVTADQVRVRFKDAQFNPTNGVDQNLRIDAIVIDGQQFETEAPNVFSTGTNSCTSMATSNLPTTAVQTRFRFALAATKAVSNFGC